MIEDIVLFLVIYHMRGLTWSWDGLEGCRGDLDFGAGGREDGGAGIEGTIRGPRGPQNNNLRDSKTRTGIDNDMGNELYEPSKPISLFEDASLLWKIV